MKRLAAWFVYPVLMTASLVGMYTALARGLSTELALVIINGTAMLVVITLERLMPHLERWNHSHGDLTTDAVHGVVNLMVLPTAVQALTFGAVQRASMWLQSRLGLASSPNASWANAWPNDWPGLWPAHWPIFGQLVLALVVTEFGQYWLHRLMHENPLLWRVHAIHHSAPRLYWLNAARVHPIDTVLTLALGVLVLVFLGVPEATLTLYLSCAGVHATLQHSNLAMRIGPLNWIASQAELHRWHHAPNRARSNHNYGTVLILWDVVFGTRYLPRDDEPPAAPGIADMPDFPRGYLAQVMAPLRWPAAREPRSSRDPAGGDSVSGR